MADFDLRVEVREIPLSQLSENTGQIPDVPKNPRKITKEKFDALHKRYQEVMNVRGADMIVWTASRDYGLDDLIFGPAERKLILRSVVPIALLNPRGDLFSLCD